MSQSMMDMSLDDIIRKKKKGNPSKPVRQTNHNHQKQYINRINHVTDARNKIISKKRFQISDARDKLAELAKQKDARLKLEQLRQERSTRSLPRSLAQRKNVFQKHSKIKHAPNSERDFFDVGRQVAYQPIASNKTAMYHQLNTKRFLESRSVETRQKMMGSVSKPKPIYRTVKNDIQIIDDPMEEEYVPLRQNPFSHKANLQLQIIAHNNDVLQNRMIKTHRTTLVEKEKSPPRPPSILKKRPMAAIRNEVNDKTNTKIDKPITEYRIIVSNLKSTVTGEDIEELFGDVGGMIESRLVRPGTAEVIYRSQEDTQKAVELYHNRQLDGQPMNCLLVTPRASAPLPRSGTKPAFFSTNSNVEPDISTFHKVLFSNS